MAEPKRAFLDFYGEHKISPVSQNVTDLQAHYNRREALYRHLGIIPSFLEGKKVLEFGPGSGHNALYTASLKPSRYVLVDGNPTGLEETRKRLASCDCEIVVKESLIQEFETEERFDMVMCEAVIPWQTEPAAMLEHVSRFVVPGGVLVISCNDEVSALVEILRRVQAHAIVDRSLPIQDQVKRLLPVFKNDLDSLAGMSRPHEDWILDQILQPFIGPVFSVESAIRTLDGTFDVFGTSPRFLVDWTWYKEVPLREESDNQMGVRHFRENLHNLLDYRFTFPPRSEEENMRLFELVGQITDDVLAHDRTGDRALLESVHANLDKLISQVEGYAPVTAEGLADFNAGLATYLAGGEFPILDTFAPLFGRGMQYLSFLRK